MSPPSKDDIRTFIAESMATEGIDGEPDEVMVDGVHHAIDVLQLSKLAIPDDARMTIILLGVLAFTYGQNVTMRRACEVLAACRPHIAERAAARRDEGQNNDAAHALMRLDEFARGGPTT